MLRNLCLILSLLFFTSQAHSEDVYKSINTHVVTDNYLSKDAVVNHDGSFLYDVKQSRTGSNLYSSYFTVFRRGSDGNYQQSQALEIAAGETSTIGKISALIYIKNYLLVLSDEYDPSHNKRVYYRFAINEQGHLNYLDKQITSHNRMDTWSNITMLTEDKFFQSLDSSISFWHISNDGMLTNLFDESLVAQGPHGGTDFLYSYSDPNTLVQIIMSKDYDNETLNFEFNKFGIDWDNNLLQTIYTKNISLESPFYNRSYDRLNNMLVKSDATAIYVRTIQREYIFNGFENDTLTLGFHNDLNLGSLGIEQTHQLAFELGGTFRQLSMNWANNQVVREDVAGIQINGTLKVLSSEMLLKMSGESKEGELWRLSQDGKVSKVNVNVENDGDLPLDPYANYYFNDETQQLLITGDADPEPGVVEAKLYVWQYDTTSNNMNFLGSSLVDQEAGTTNTIGSVGNHYYVYTKRGLTTSANVISNTDLGLQSNQKYILSDIDNALFVDEVFLANDNTLVAEMYGNVLQDLTLKICNLDEQLGVIVDCTISTVFSDLEFSRDFDGYTFHKISNDGLFLFAPDSSSEALMESFLLVEFDGENFVIKQSFPLGVENGRYAPITQILTLNQGTDIFFRNAGAVKHLQLVDGMWTLSNTPSQILIGGGVTGSFDYSIDTLGRPFIFDTTTSTFWMTNQTVNLTGWFQLVADNKGFAINIDDTFRGVTTFEFVDTKPSVYKNNFSNGATYYATQDELFELDLSQYFLNIESYVRVETADKFTLEQGKLKGILNNDDIINGEYSDGKEIDAKLYLGQQYIGFFDIVPVNVNDAPELIVQISREYLQTNNSYEVNLNDYVLDPDKDYLTFTASGLPDGYNLENNYIRGNSPNTGSYNIAIMVTDNNGGNLNFSIPITINDTGTAQSSTPAAETSSGGGSSGYKIIILLILGLFFRFKFRLR